MDESDEDVINRFFDLIDQAVDGLTAQERMAALDQLEEFVGSVQIKTQVH